VGVFNVEVCFGGDNAVVVSVHHGSVFPYVNTLPESMDTN
jgi:hypothetical protein